ncbi:alpha/beta fold hydrolase [Umezawaea endophytica]|uniref:Alpha/beta hydrolase n=1 Tax=Umezawaea endophytica TaxID=1654476 RepID=A0A9X2VLE1_9PSEU|nr:alpha/beta hydrolase [Umezawaea endophytica]MCS7478715.1 alpha/beta hydrolase [Umezawaea endophytica]
MFKILRCAAIGVLTLSLTVSLPAEGASWPPAPKPTVVFVHGAFADSSGWTGVMQHLRKNGYPVRAATNPLRGLAGDSAYVADFLRGITGPIILVGHSYGGMVITNAAVGVTTVKALVYVAALAPDAGESLGGLSARPVEHPVPALPLQPVTINQPDGSTATDLYLDLAEFRATFAADVDPTTAANMAATQRPLNATATTDLSATPAWKTIPSWFLVATGDQTIAPDLQRFMAQRAGSHTIEVKTSHAAMVSQPSAVARLIGQADRSTR